MATRSDGKTWGTLGPLLAARAKLAGPDRCLICRRPLARERHHNRRMCGRRSCLLEYRRLHDRDAHGERSQKVIRVYDTERAGRVLEVLACGHRLIVWRTRSGRTSRRCQHCRAGLDKRAKALDLTALPS